MMTVPTAILAAACLVTVSYTHLDVYKRQVRVHAPLDKPISRMLLSNSITLTPGTDVYKRQVLGKYVSTGHFHRAVQKAGVHRAHLHGDVPLVQGLSGPAVAGHAFDQCKRLLSIVPQQQK